jgi:hypothetical protein
MRTTAQSRPNRRYRRLIPAALTAAALTLGSTGVAGAAAPRPAAPPPAHVRGAHGPPTAVVSTARTDPGAGPTPVTGR